MQHFSHQHPLRLLNIQQHSAGSTVSCSGCKLAISRWAYCCLPCNFWLHQTCSRMPQELSHSIDPKHTLTLTPTPAYQGGAFVCNACGKIGTGFSYHCPECQLDLHSLCAFAPPPIPVAPPPQQVNYPYARPPYPSISIPTVPGPGFISHPSPYLPHPYLQPGWTAMRSLPFGHGHGHYPSVIGSPYPGPGPSQRNDRGESSLLGHAIQGIFEGLGQEAGTAILQGFLGN